MHIMNQTSQIRFSQRNGHALIRQLISSPFKFKVQRLLYVPPDLPPKIYIFTERMNVFLKVLVLHSDYFCTQH